MLLPLAPEPFTCPTDRDMTPSERREFVRTHRTCVYGYGRRQDGPAMSIVYYVPTDTDELLVSTMAGRGKARAVARNEKVSLCVLDERWPFAYLQVYADATVEDDPELVVDVMMAVAGRMSGIRPSSTKRRSVRMARLPGSSVKATRVSSAFNMLPPWLNTSPCQDQLPVMVQSVSVRLIVWACGLQSFGSVPRSSTVPKTSARRTSFCQISPGRVLGT